MDEREQAADGKGEGIGAVGGPLFVQKAADFARGARLFVEQRASCPDEHVDVDAGDTGSTRVIGGDGAEEAGNYYTDMVQIEGGMDHLPRAFLPELRGRIRFGAKMIALDQSTAGVTIHYQTAGGRFSVSGDYAILTVPFPVLRHMEMLKPFSRGKQRAIRQLHYDASAKIFIQCRRRFWEDDDGIAGGGSFTDLPIRVVFYPEHGRETGRGVLLASYTWAEEAQRWGSLTPGDRVTQALENLACMHPQVGAEFEVGASKMWHDDEFAGGAFALFDPGQQTLLHDHIVGPEGRFYFAGEHTSFCHAWIQGAIESGLRAAFDVHTAPA